MSSIVASGELGRADLAPLLCPQYDPGPPVQPFTRPRFLTGTRRWTLSGFAPLLGVAAATVLLLVRLVPDVRGKPIFEDEALAGLVSAHSFLDVLHTVHDRGGAPLHFALAHVALRLDPSAAGLRWLSVVFAVATVPVCYDLGRRVAGTTAGVAAALVTASSQMLGVYGSFGRMYALLAFVATLAVDLFVRAVQERTRGAAFAAALGAWLLPAVHPFGAVLLVAEAVVGAFVWRGRNLKPAVPVILVGLALVPFIFSDFLLADRFSASASGATTVVTPHRAGVVLEHALGGFGGGLGPVFLVFLFVALAGTVALWRRGERPFVALVALAVVGLPLLLVTARSGRGFSDHFSSRQLIFLLPLWATVVGAGFAWLTRALPPAGQAAVLALFTGVALLSPSAVVDPRSRLSATPTHLAAPVAWLKHNVTSDAVLFPNSPVFLAALRSTRHARALSREQPILILRALRRTAFPVSAVIVAVPLDEVEVRTADLRLRHNQGLRPHVFASWLLLESRGPFANKHQVLHEIEQALSAARSAIDEGSVELDDYLRQSTASVCGSLDSLEDGCT